VSAKSRLLVVTSTFPRWPGDDEPPFVFELSRRLVRDFEVTVLAPHAPGALTLEQFEGMEVRRFRYCFESLQLLAYEGGILANLKRSRWVWLLVPLFFVAQWFALVRLMAGGRFRWVHAHWIVPQALSAVAARVVAAGRAPAIVCTSHGGDLYGLRGRFAGALKRMVMRRVDRMTVVSAAMREDAATMCGRSDLAVLSMGVDCRTRFFPDASVRRADGELLFVGRLVEKKGVAVLLDALPAILQACPTVRLTLVGRGPDEAALRQRAAKLGIAANVDFVGPIANARLPEFYRRATLFVAPSVIARDGDQEGLGLVYAEALACECPVVASDLAAIRDVVADGVSGRTARAGDSVDLSACVIELLGDPEQRARLARAGRAAVCETFDWDAVARRYAALFHALP